jgi:HSP20 family molecular chaperone IbpA
MKSSKVSTSTSETPSSLLRAQDPDKLRWEMQPIQLAIARRAFELFEKRGREHGHDWEDWFKAESEFLCPVSIMTSESEERLSVRVNVLGFTENELQVSIEPRHLAIVGKREGATFRNEAVPMECADQYPDQILRLIDLRTEVDPARSVVELQAGMLKFELPKVVKKVRGTAPAAA